MNSSNIIRPLFRVSCWVLRYNFLMYSVIPVPGSIPTILQEIRDKSCPPRNESEFPEMSRKIKKWVGKLNRIGSEKLNIRVQELNILESIALMELPDDVLLIIRAYAKPWFKYHAIYKLILVNTGRDSFPELRDCLHCIPDQILPTLVKFEKSHAEYLVARDNFVCDEPWDYSKQMEYYSKRRILFDRQREVKRVVRMLCRNYEFKWGTWYFSCKSCDRVVSILSCQILTRDCVKSLFLLHARNEWENQEMSGKNWRE